MPLPSTVARLVALLGKLPGVGEKTAQRLAFHLIKAPPSYAIELAEALFAVAQGVKLCSVCCNLTDSDPCIICRDQKRDASLICVVESVPDLLAIERSGEYRGLYHVLHGVLSPLDGIGPEELRITPLLERLRSGEVKEVILATNPDVEGEATSLYLHRLLGHLGVAISRIAQGMPMGGDIEFADLATIGRALSARRPI